MNISFKRFIAYILVIMTALPFSLLSFSVTSYSLNESWPTVFLGSYPKTHITDEETVNQLNSLVTDDDFIDMNYYIGNGTMGSEEVVSYEFYADVNFNGNKYRALKFSEYRPNSTYDNPPANKTNNQFTKNGGYYWNMIHWFIYEPVEWCVLDSDSGLVISKEILEGQPFNNIVDESVTFENSTLKEYLNGIFFDTVFDIADREMLVSGDDCFRLLSLAEVTNSDYGFNPDDTAADPSRAAYATDYAVANGVMPMSSYYGSIWYLSDITESNTLLARTCYNTKINNANKAAIRGIRPVTCFDPEKLGLPNDSPADYSEVDSLIDSIPDNLNIYTDSSVSSLMSVLQSVVRDLPADEQDTVDGYASNLSAAINGLYKEPVASVNGNRFVRGQSAVWTVVTPDDVVWLRFTDNYTTASGTSDTHSISCKYNKANIGTTLISVSDENGMRTWTISMPLTYPGTSVSADQIWNIDYKRSGSSIWEPVNNPGETGRKTPYTQDILVAKNADILIPPASDYDKYSIIEASADSQNGTFTVVTTDDVSKIRILYTSAETGKVKSLAYQLTSTSVRTESENGLTVWYINYKFDAKALDDTYIVQARGPAWGEGVNVTV